MAENNDQNPKLFTPENTPVKSSTEKGGTASRKRENSSSKTPTRPSSSNEGSTAKKQKVQIHDTATLQAASTLSQISRISQKRSKSPKSFTKSSKLKHNRESKSTNQSIGFNFTQNSLIDPLNKNVPHILSQNPDSTQDSLPTSAFPAFAIREIANIETYQNLSTTHLASNSPSVFSKQTQSLTQLHTPASLTSTFTALTSGNRLKFLKTLATNLTQAELSYLHKTIEPRLRHDILSDLPSELAQKILAALPPKDLLTCSNVSKLWNTLASDQIIWKEICENDDVVDGFNKKDFLSKRKILNNWTSSNLHDKNHELPKNLQHIGRNIQQTYALNQDQNANWVKAKNPHLLQSKCHDEQVITCLFFDGKRIISASDDCSLCVFEERKTPKTRERKHSGGNLRRSSRLQNSFNDQNSQHGNSHIGNPQNSQSSSFNTSFLNQHSPTTAHNFSNHQNSPSYKEWETTKKNHQHVLKGRLVGHRGGVWCMAAFGDIMVSGSTDREIRVWNLLTMECQAVLRGHYGTVRCLDIYSGTNVNSMNKFVSGSRDCTLRLWSYDTPKLGSQTNPAGDLVSQIVRQLEHQVDGNDTRCLKILNGHVAAARCVKWSPCGKKVVSGAYDFTVRIWDVEDNKGECLHVLQGHVNRVYSLEISPCGKYIFSGGLDSFIRIWEMETGNCKFQLSGHQSLTSSLVVTETSAFSKPIEKLDGKRLPGEKRLILFSANADSTVRVWDVESGQCLNIVGTRVDRGGIPYGTMNVSPEDGNVLIATGLDLIQLNSNTGNISPIQNNNLTPVQQAIAAQHAAANAMAAQMQAVIQHNVARAAIDAQNQLMQNNMQQNNNLQQNQANVGNNEQNGQGNNDNQAGNNNNNRVNVVNPMQNLLPFPNFNNSDNNRSADAVTGIEIVHCPYTLPELEKAPGQSVLQIQNARNWMMHLIYKYLTHEQKQPFG